MSNGISAFTEGDDTVTLTNIICDLKAKAGDDRITVKDVDYTFIILEKLAKTRLLAAKGGIASLAAMMALI